MSVDEINKKKILFGHQVCLLVGPKDYWSEFLRKELIEFLKIENLNNSPDIWWQSYESFGIKDSHNLIGRESRKSFGGKGKFFVLEISSITPEAQNALLKTFEEPIPDTHFFIIARSAEIFLPTVRSRMMVLEADQNLEAKPSSQDGTEVVSRVARSDFSEGEKKISAQKFLKLDLPDRLDFIQKEFLLVRNASRSDVGGKSKDKTKSEIIDFVIDLEKTFRSQIEMRKISKEEELALRELQKCQRYLQNPRSSNRLILEHLALILP